MRCIENCGCEPPEGPDLDLRNDSLDRSITYEACSTITASEWTVENGGAVTLRAGERVALGPGVTIRGSLQIAIDPALAPP